MPVKDKLASSLGRRDEVPNQELAQEIADAGDKKAVKELIGLLQDKNKGIQSDAIKVLYETGERKPGLIAAYSSAFADLLEHKNNRMVWGSMAALDTIALKAPQQIYEVLGKLVDVADKGSVITRDRLVSILSKLASFKEYSDDAFVLLLEQLQSCPTNQLPMYAEYALAAVNDNNKSTLITVLNSRLKAIEQESKRKRIEKVIRKIS